MQQQYECYHSARILGRRKMLLLGLQHLFAMFGATILVPILVNGYFHGEGLSVQVTLFCAGFGTLLFHFCTKLKVPAFLGSSFAFLVPIVCEHIELLHCFAIPAIRPALAIR